MRVEDQYRDVLQNIEFGIVNTYRRHPDMLDYDVMRALEAVMDGYRAEKIGRPPREVSLSETEQELVAAVRSMCEWRLGRGPLNGAEPAEASPPAPITVDEAVLCLKRLLKSAKTWNRQRGRQGYLSFIIQYVR